MSANGHFIPPFFVFPRQRMNDRLMINAPAESVGVAQPKGWMTSDFFLRWMHQFVKHSHPSKESPVLLLVDGHCSHKTLAVINFCRENNIHLISSPPHTTHKLQPLDRTFMRPFKDAYHQRCDMWMRANAGSRITDYDIAGLVNEAFTKVARLDIAASGFKCTGIYPFDRHLFSDLDYLAADMTNIPLEEPGTSSKTTNYSSKDSVSVADLAIAESTAATCKLASREFPKFPHCSINETIFSSPQSSTSLDPDITQALHKLSPLPDAAKKRSAARKRKCERSEILTSSPYKIAVIEKENEKNSKEKKKKVKINLKSAMKKEGEQRKDAKAKGKRGKQAQGEKSKNKDERDHQLNHLKKKELLA